MSQFKDSSVPELVPRSPIFINGVKFDPKTCVDSADLDVPHTCVHDWRCYWGNQNRPI